MGTSNEEWQRKVIITTKLQYEHWQKWLLKTLGLKYPEIQMSSKTHGTVDKGIGLDPVTYPKSVSSILSEGSGELSEGKLTGNN